MECTYTNENKLIAASKAFKRGNYECPECRGSFDFCSGKSNKPYFRHSRDVPKAIKQACKFYSATSTFNNLELEGYANQQVRLVVTPINGSYNISQFLLIFLRFAY